MKVLEIRNVWFYYEDEPVLKDISLEVEEGELIAILGPNGAGKTTLLKIILGILKPQQGEIKIFRKKIEELGDERRKIGYVPQNLVPNRKMPIKVSSVVLMGLYRGILKFPGEEDRKALKEALEIVEMDHMADRQFNQLSGGQRQRVLIARALVSKPKLLILDEPETGLDPSFHEGFFNLLARIRKVFSTTVLIVTHDVTAVSAVVDKIACVNRELITHGRPEEVLTGENLECLYGKGAAFFGHGPAPHIVVGKHHHD